MADAILQATIKAFDEFTQQFQKFQQELKKTEQAEKQVTVSTQTVNEAMTGLIQAKTKAADATDKFNKVLAEMARGEVQGIDATKRFNTAFNEMVAAERRAEQETAKLNATLRAYNLTGKETQAVVGQVDRALNSLGDQHQQHAHHVNNDMMQTMALVSAFYGMVRAMQAVFQTGREFELGIRQAQAVTGEMTSALRDFAMAARDSIYAPTQMADAFYALGSAGLSANETLVATPAILDFATAGLLDMDSAAHATISTIKAFQLEWGQATEVTDAFTAAMNSTTLNAPDFQWVMATAGAVGKLAAQDFREVVAAAAAMKDSGLQAQDAGTSIKAAFLALMSPSNEARRIITDLGVKIYDASGQMKQWHEIVGEFEQALAPYNDEARNMILSTILGTDGIRAMATGLNMGSEKLSAYVEDMKAADGATEKMASAMADTFDGALRKVNGNLERAKILMFEGFSEGAATNVLGAINTLVVGFNSLDESGRAVIEMLVGAAGLIVAIKALIGTAQMLGITLSAVTGPIGLTLMALTGLAGAVLAFQGSQEQLNQKLKDSVRENLNQADSIEKLLAKYQELAGKTELTKEEQSQLDGAIKDLTDAVPSAITGFDDMGKAITNVGTASEETRKKMAELRAEAVRNAELNAQIARAQMPKLQQQLDSAAKKRDEARSYLNYLDTGAPLNDLWQAAGAFPGALPMDETKIKYQAGAILGRARDEYEAANNELKAAKDTIQLAEDIKKGKLPSASSTTKGGGGTGGGDGGGGNKPYNPPGGADEANKALDAAKKYTDALTAALYPYRAASEAAANSVSILGAKEQNLVNVMKTGQGTMYQAVELNKVRTEQYAALIIQQTKLEQLESAERKQLSELEAQYKKAADPEAAKELRQEIENLNGSIAQTQQAWWQVEQQKLASTEEVRQEEQKRYDDAYQEAMDLMRHETTMARMSTEEQIRYLEKLRDAHQWTQQQMWNIEEDLYGKRKQQLNEFLDGFEDGYKEKLDAIDNKTKETVKGFQDQIDALDAEDKTADRTETTSKHDEKISDLQEKRRYHELRTGKEHQKAIADIDEEIAEENRQYKLETNKWARDDKKESLQDQLDAARESGEEEKKQLTEHYREVVDLAKEGALDTLAALAATDPQWLETGKNWIQNLMDGISLKAPEFQTLVQNATSVMEGYKAQVPEAPDEPQINVSPSGVGGLDNGLQWSIAQGQYTQVNGRSAMWSRELANLLGMPVTMNQATGMVEIGGKSFAPLKVENGQSYLSIRDVAEAFGYSVGWDEENKAVEIYKQYALGGPVSETGPAFLHQGEYVLTTTDSRQLANLVPVLTDLARAYREGKAKTGGTVVNGPLVSIDKVQLDGEQDTGIFGRELGRGIESVLGGA